MNYLFDFIYAIPEFFNYYLYIRPDYTSPESFLKTVDPKIQNIIVEYLNLEDITRVYEENDSEITKFIHKFKHPLPSLRDANKYGLLNIFKYLARSGSVVTEYEMIVSIAHGNLDILKYVIELGIVPQNCLIDDAIQGGHLHIIQFLLSIGLKPLESSIDMAVEYGKHEVAEYLKNKVFN